MHRTPKTFARGEERGAPNVGKWKNIPRQAKRWSSPKNWRVQQTTIDISIAVFSLCCCFIFSIAVIVPLRVKGLPSNISIAVGWLGGAEGNGRKVAVHAQTRPCLVGGPDQRLDL